MRGGVKIVIAESKSGFKQLRRNFVSVGLRFHDYLFLRITSTFIPVHLKAIIYTSA